MGLEHPKVGIVGGTGKMGSWFGDVLEGLGLEVMRCGRSTELRPKDVASLCDVVVVSVPIKDTVSVIEQIGPLVRKDALLMDLCSVKTEPVSAMLKYSRSQVVGLHPLFGPRAGQNSHLSVAVCPARGEEGLRWITRIIKKAELKPVVLPPLLHDHIMGLIQGAHHFSVLALAQCIMRSGYSVRDLLKLSTPSFKQTLERIGSILDQTPDLFGPLMMDNAFSRQFIESYRESCEQLAEIIANKQDEIFKDVFLSLKKYFGQEEHRNERDLGKGRSVA